MNCTVKLDNKLYSNLNVIHTHTSSANSFFKTGSWYYAITNTQTVNSLALFIPCHSSTGFLISSSETSLSVQQGLITDSTGQGLVNPACCPVRHRTSNWKFLSPILGGEFPEQYPIPYRLQNLNKELMSDPLFENQLARQKLFFTPPFSPVTSSHLVL